MPATAGCLVSTGEGEYSHGDYYGVKSFWQALPKPKSETGFWSWVTTVDHKRIGIMYFWTSLFFFLSAASRRC